MIIMNLNTKQLQGHIYEQREQTTKGFVNFLIKENLQVNCMLQYQSNRIQSCNIMFIGHQNRKHEIYFKKRINFS